MVKLMVEETKWGDSDDSDGDDIKTGGVGRGKKKKLYPLPKGRDGMPQLPSFEGQSKPSLEERKNVIRSIFTHSYRTFPTLAPFLTHWDHTGAFTHNKFASVGSYCLGPTLLDQGLGC